MNFHQLRIYNKYTKNCCLTFLKQVETYPRLWRKHYPMLNFYADNSCLFYLFLLVKWIQMAKLPVSSAKMCLLPSLLLEKYQSRTAQNHHSCLGSQKQLSMWGSEEEEKFKWMIQHVRTQKSVNVAGSSWKLKTSILENPQWKLAA